jgi:hypothetical protein
VGEGQGVRGKSALRCGGDGLESGALNVDAPELTRQCRLKHTRGARVA